MSTPRHRITALAFALFGAVALSGCVATNFSAQTDQQYQAAVGANVRDGALQVYNALFVDNGDGTATFSGAVLADEADETITKVTSTGARIEFTGPVSVAQDSLVTLGTTAEIVAVLGDLAAGGYVPITLTSSTGATVTVNAPIVDRTSMYDSVAKAPAPAAATDTDDEDAAGQ